MSTLPDCDELFLRFFDHWYRDDDRSRKGFPATRPDMTQHDELIGFSGHNAGPLVEETQQVVLDQIGTMIKAARADWPQYLKVSGDIDVEWIDAFDKHYDRERIANVIESADPTSLSNEYVVLCCEFGAALGHVMREIQPRLIWYLEWPYWESSLLDPDTGHLIPVFHWAIKKMSEYGVEDGYVAKLLVSLEILDRPDE